MGIIDVGQVTVTLFTILEFAMPSVKYRIWCAAMGYLDGYDTSRFGLSVIWYWSTDRSKAWAFPSADIANRKLELVKRQFPDAVVTAK